MRVSEETEVTIYGPPYLGVAALTRGRPSGPGIGAVFGAAVGLGPGYGQRLTGFCPIGGCGGSMPVTVCVLLDRVLACSATARDADKWSREQLCSTGADFNNKPVLVGSFLVYQ